MEEEVWKDIPGYEGLYQVSNYGKVVSLNYNHTGTKREIVLRVDRQGYLCVNLHKRGTTNTRKAHRLVAEAFIPNPLNHPQVNHRDENKQNNFVGNLEWCDASYNNRYGTRPRRVLDAHKLNGGCKAERPVLQIGLSGDIIGEYVSISAAARHIGVARESLRDCVLGRQKTCKGYLWIYKQ